MDFNEFSTHIRKSYRGSKRQAKVRGSFGVYDVYKLIRKNKWYDIGRPLKEKEFYGIIRRINKLLASEIANGQTVIFPERMGKLELRKTEKGVGIVNGKLKVTYPIDWNKTVRLWYEDEEANKNKTLVRDEQKLVYHVKYCKQDATYENKVFYQFVLNRFIKKALKENIKKDKIDTLYG